MIVLSSSKDILLMESTLKKYKIDPTDSYAYKMYELRQAKHHFSFNEHVEAMVLSLLSANRPWKQIVENLDNLREIFCNWDAELIKHKNPAALEFEIGSIGCGNRAINRQMQGLTANIELLQRLQERVEDLEYLVAEDPYEVSDLLSSYPWKLNGFAQTLALQYLRNVGVDTCKPDVHIRRILARIGFTSYEECSISEIMSVMKQLSAELGLPVTLINEIVWYYGASGYVEMCTKSPKCSICQIMDCRYRS